MLYFTRGALLTHVYMDKLDCAMPSRALLYNVEILGQAIGGRAQISNLKSLKRTLKRALGFLTVTSPR